MFYKLPLVSVIIPTYHDWDRLQLCIDALKRQSYPADKFEVIIVNNDPDDVPPDLNLNNNFFFTTESKCGSYAARNAGIKISRGEVLAFTDSDCIPDKKWIENAVSSLSSEYPRIAGGITLFFSGNYLTIAEIYEKAHAFPQAKHVNQDDFGATANMITYRSVFDMVGYFDESLFSGGDLEWGQRAASHGFQIKYLENTIVYHPARKNLQEILNKSRRLVGGKYSCADNKVKFVSKYFLLQLLPPIFVGRDIFLRNNLTLYEKLISILVFYFLKLSKNIELASLVLGIKNPERK